MALLEVKDLRVTFETANGSVRAVNDISFELRRGEILALVGESGSGKTVSSLSLSGLLPGNAETTGSVLLDGEEILGAPPRRLRQVRKRKIAYVFQDPMSSLNPARRIGSQLEEVLRVNTSMRRTAARERAIELLAHVGIPSPKRHLRSYPHQLSGGMSQRVMIAIALASEPALIIADEATSSLDVSIQGQILELLKRVREDFDTAMLVVTHDFGVVSGLADSIAVMYGGGDCRIRPDRDGAVTAPSPLYGGTHDELSRHCRPGGWGVVHNFRQLGRGSLLCRLPVPVRASLPTCLRPLLGGVAKAVAPRTGSHGRLFPGGQ